MYLRHNNISISRLFIHIIIVITHELTPIMCHTNKILYNLRITSFLYPRGNLRVYLFLLNKQPHSSTYEM